MQTLARAWLAVFATAGFAFAQTPEIGAVVDPPIVPRWRTPFPAGRESASPRVIVWLPEQRVPLLRALHELRALVARFEARCEFGVVVEDEDRLPLLSRVNGVAVCVDASGRARERLGPHLPEDGEAHAVVLDASGRLLSVRALTPSLEYWIEDVIEGAVDHQIVGMLEELQRAIDVARQTREWGAVRHAAAGLQSTLPTRIEPWLAQITGLPVGARLDESWVRAAAIALANRPEYLAPVLGAAVRVRPELAKAAWLDEYEHGIVRTGMPSREACALAFELAVARGDEDSANAWSFAWVERCKGMPRRLAELARHFGAKRFDGRFDEARLTALDLAIRMRPVDLDLVRAKLDLLTTRYKDWVAADRVGRVLVESMTGNARALNSFAWRLLTEEPYRGRLPRLALHAARAMESDDEWRTYWRLDTLALAEFENGNVATAVRLQEEAVDGCDSASRVRYGERLARYRAAQNGKGSGRSQDR